MKEREKTNERIGSELMVAVVNDCPKEAEKFVVARLNNGLLWYFMSFDTYEEAISICQNFSDAAVLRNPEID